MTASRSLSLRWNELVRALPKSSEELAGKWWQVIESRYSEPQRAYHTLHHLEAMFVWYDRIAHLFQAPLTVSMAIFFHDIIYEPTRSDNEQQSADLFIEFSEEARMEETQRETVREWIIDTIKHEGVSGRTNCDQNLFIDIDLSILGESRERYRQYAKEIRQEYIHVEDEAFRTGRRKVLQHFLESKGGSIFKSQYFHDALESQAVSNIEWEVDALAQGLIKD